MSLTYYLLPITSKFIMTITCTKSQINGEIAAVPSKSAAHRLMICSALSEIPTVLYGDLQSKDLIATRDCLTALGSVVGRDDPGAPHDRVVITPIKNVKKGQTLNCGESGSTLRFLMPLCCALGADSVFTGEGKLPQRPIGETVTLLKEKGIKFSAETLPFQSRGKLKSGVFKIRGDVSSQYISALLMALPVLDGDSEIITEGELQSVDYIKLTLNILRDFNINIKETESGYFVKGGQKFVSKGGYKVEGDFSNAAFFLCAGAVAGKIAVSNLDINSAQGDKEVLSILARIGGRVGLGDFFKTPRPLRGHPSKILEGNDESHPSAIAATPPQRGIDGGITVEKNKLNATQFDAGNIPDLVPVLATVLGVCEGESVIYNVDRLRLKESDRIRSTIDLVTNLGGRIRYDNNRLIINGVKSYTGGTVDSFNDHRIVMSAAVASLVSDKEVEITNAQAVNKSYPQFFEDFKKVGGVAGWL